MPVVINGTTGINTPGQTTAGEQIVQRADTNDLLRLSRTGSSAGDGYLYSNANEIFGVKDTGTTYPFLVKRGAPSNSFTIDSSGRLTTPNQPSFSAYSNNGSSITTSATARVMPYSNVLTNIGSCYSSNRFTAPIAGTYFFSCSALLLGGGSGNLVLFKNGSSIGGSLSNGRAINGTNESTISQAITVTLAANDYVEVYYYNDGGANQFYGAHGSFCGTLLG